MNDALKGLIDAVDAGDVIAAINWSIFGWKDHSAECCANIFKAHNGDLNAAKALHDALLPGWIFDVTNGSAFVMRDLPDADLTHDMCPQYLGEADSPARAWLLAILRAKLAENHPRQETSV